MWFKKKSKKETLKKETVDALKKLKRKRIAQESIEFLNLIIKVYLHQKYDLSESLTAQETLKQLGKKRMNEETKKEFSNLLIEIYHEEYKKKENVKRKELNALIKKAVQVVRKI